MIIAVDFDGTCTTHEYPRIGRDIGAEPVLRRLVAAGHHIILWTMRSGRELEDAQQWFRTRNIPLFGVNRNPQQKSWTKSVKAHADLYIDDKALGCPLCEPEKPGEMHFVDWAAVEKLLARNLAGAPKPACGETAAQAKHAGSVPPQGLMVRLLAFLGVQG